MVQVVQQQHPHHTQPIHQRRNSSSIRSGRKRTWWSSSASWISSLLYNNNNTRRSGSGSSNARRSNSNNDGRGLLGLEELTLFPRYRNADDINADAGFGGGSISTSKVDGWYGGSTTTTTTTTRRGRGRPRRPIKKAWLMMFIMFLGGMMALYVTFMIVTSTPIQPHHLYESKNKKKTSFLSSVVSSLAGAVFFGSHDPSTTTTVATPTTTGTVTTTNPTTLKGASFRILCTSTNKKIEWGSYQIRCRDLKSWAERCTATTTTATGGEHKQSGRSGGTGGVYVATDLSFSDMYRRRWIRWWLGQLRDEEQYRYDATIFVKAFPSLNRLLPNVFGDNLFVDLVDEYKYQGDQIPRQYKLIAQTSWQGYEKFPNHQTSTVEHWYNSYPRDMLKSEIHSTGRSNGNSKNNYDDGYPDGMPVIDDDNDTEDSQRSCLHFATIWNTKRDKGPHEGGCPTLSKRHSSLNITYDCLDLEFDISKWYLDYILREPGQGTTATTTSHNLSPAHLDDSRHHHHYHNAKFHSLAEARVDMATTLRDPMLGPGKLYYNIFQNYDVLVVLTKNDTEKLHYGNVQRTISQMRSGVPVLLDVRGRVLHDFMEKYNYTCAFQRYPDRANADHDNVAGGGDDGKRRNYWTFDEAVEQMRNADIRRQCQRQGLDIVKDYSPSKIGQKFLRTIGYRGDFIC